jgi:pyruvate dehydrogenase E2 component (dihydrolipoamide acetyltransferase)
MASRVVMPKLTDTMEEGVVLKWKKKEGEAVGAGDVLAEIETDKAVMDLEAFASGVLRRVVAAEGETVKAGALIGVIAEPDEDIASFLAEATSTVSGANVAAKPTVQPAPSPPAKPATAAPAPKEAAQIPKDVPAGAVKASPRAKARARERGIELASVTGSGPEGRIVEEDVLKASTGRPMPSDSTDRPLSQMRKAIARTTSQSKGPVPHFYVTTDVDMEEADRFRHQYKLARSTHPGLNDMILKAVAMALTRHPEINVSFAGEVIRQHAAIDIGIAVGVEDGLISPVLRDCGNKSLSQISAGAHALIERARNRQLQPEEYTGATFSVSNLGMFDVESFIAVLMPPQAAAIAVGSLRDVPVVTGGTVRAGRRMKITLSCDHRALDGVQAAKFLKELKRILEHPLELVLPPNEEEPS